MYYLKVKETIKYFFLSIMQLFFFVQKHKGGNTTIFQKIINYIIRMLGLQRPYAHFFFSFQIIDIL